MGLFSRSPQQKMDRALDRLDKAAHYYENWIYPFSAFNSEREKDKELDHVVDLFAEAVELAEKYPELKVDPADVLSRNMEKWVGWRAEETGRTELIGSEAD